MLQRWQYSDCEAKIPSLLKGDSDHWSWERNVRKVYIELIFGGWRTVIDNFSQSKKSSDKEDLILKVVRESRNIDKFRERLLISNLRIDAMIST